MRLGGIEKMQRQSKSGRGVFPFSMKDTILLGLCGFSGLLCFALSFTLMQPDGRPYLFGGSLAVFVVGLLFAEKRKDIFLGTIAFILLRLVWGALIEGLHVLVTLGHRW